MLDFSLAIWKDKSDSAKNFIARLIEKNPEKRMTASDCLSHEWMVKYSSNKLSTYKEEENLQETLVRIKDFNAETKFQVVTINYILNFIETPLQLERLKREFEALDLNHDGEISYDELLVAYRRIYGPEAELIVEELFSRIDLDQSGKISFS